MSKKIVVMEHINKNYRGFAALKDVNIELDSGKIYGLIGKNGAGKTTIMRLIVGLSFPSSGTITTNADEIGTLIEYPSLNGGLTAAENMRFCYKLKGMKYDESSSELLQLVGLDDTGKKKVKDFSLGMRQRLGIAIAMIGKPELLILDEPVNGLDPIGVIEIRKLIQKLNSEMGYTILISSHNLPELDKVATDFIIIDKGRIIETITAQELQSKVGDDLEAYFIETIEKARA